MSKLRRTLQLPLSLCPLALVISCGSTGFTSESAKQTDRSADASSAPVQKGAVPKSKETQSNAPALPKCENNAATQVTLLTNTVQNGVAGNFVEYKMSVTDCDGKQIPFTASAVSFDLASYVGAQANLTYVITDAGDSSHTVRGTLNNLQGNDLFGNSGPNYYHYETDQPVSFAAQANAIIVHIDLMGISMTPYGTSSPLEMNTYLKFGNAAPVKAPVQLSQAAPAPGGLGTIINQIFKRP